MKTATIKSIKSIGIKNTYDITMKKNHNFFLGNGILTHNSSSSQAVLRRVIEKSSKNCRFIFSCNYPNKIIPAISDRCVVFRFKAIKTQEMAMLLKKIVAKENIPITPSAIHTLASLSRGSMRNALTILQTLKLSGITEITDKEIYDMTYWVDMDYIKKLLGSAKIGDLDSIDKRINDLLYEKAYLPEEILNFMVIVIKESDINRSIKLNLLMKIGSIEYYISQGANPYVQLMSFMMYVTKQLSGGK